MDQFLEDYKAYYKARMERWAGNSDYSNSYEAEKALYEAMASCNELLEFKDKIGDLNVKNAIALVKDQETLRLKHFNEIQEPIRAKGPEFSLERIDEAKTDMDVVEIASNAEQEAMILISVDLMTDHFYGDVVHYLEEIDIYSNADVPDEYKTGCQRIVNQAKEKIKEGIEELEERAQYWQKGWKFNPDLVWEFRHRRKIPLPDNVLQQRLNEFKNLNL